MLGCKGLTPGVTGKNFPQLRTLMLLERKTKNNKFNQTNKNTFLPKSLREQKFSFHNFWELVNALHEKQTFFLALRFSAFFLSLSSSSISSFAFFMASCNKTKYHIPSVKVRIAKFIMLFVFEQI